jgi:hypothetical protein
MSSRRAKGRVNVIHPNERFSPMLKNMYMQHRER